MKELKEKMGYTLLAAVAISAILWLKWPADPRQQVADHARRLIEGAGGQVEEISEARLIRPPGLPALHGWAVRVRSHDRQHGEQTEWYILRKHGVSIVPDRAALDLGEEVRAESAQVIRQLEAAWEGAGRDTP